ncbi:entericidin [Rhizobium sp. CFBP 8762]|uniref:entericidin domain-containing protein n=1 Tax=Rhizobium sp. CFBP 8762 TaxID=2775279 RepID=UPI001781E0A7|nr:entericidin [Rhizobium sp. CFBP 8762]MBD8554747.1 entericidin [Rhizobium sp. CFBP 8762]
MNPSLIAKISATVFALVALSACGNTVRGVGKDVAGTVNGVQDAGRSVDGAAKY